MKYQDVKDYCHYDLVHFLHESILLKNQFVIAVYAVRKMPDELTDREIDVFADLKIYLGLADEDGKYEVIVYKATEKDKLLKSKEDEYIKYEDKGEYYSFVFDTFNKARTFTAELLYRHEEFLRRPFKPVPMDRL